MLCYYFPKDLQCLPQFTKWLDNFMEEKSTDNYRIASPLLNFTKSVIMMCWKPSRYCREVPQPDRQSCLKGLLKHLWQALLRLWSDLRSGFSTTKTRLLR